MARMSRRLAAAFATASALGAAGAAWADPAKVVTSTGAVMIGRDPEWRAAKPGAEIAETDFLNIADGARITVLLPDGSKQDLEGKAMVSGRRLLSDRSAAGKLVFFSKSFQDAAATRVEFKEGTTTIATRGAKVDDRETLGQSPRRRGIAFLGEDDEGLQSSDADHAESYLRRGNYVLAIDRAWLVLRDPDARPMERRRAHLVMGQVAAGEGNYERAIRDFDGAAAPVADGDRTARTWRQIAIVQRGQSLLASGNDVRAVEDFREALDIDADSAAAAQARFFLGAIALSSNDMETARYQFGKLGSFPELRQAGEELLAAVGQP